MREIKFEELMENFSWHLYPKGPRLNQKKAFEVIAKSRGSLILELPTGSGKTEIAHSFLKTLEEKGLSPLFHIAVTKSQVNQVKKWYPEVKVVYGRNEYPCLFYREKEKEISAEEAPCSLLKCPHRVDQETGKTEEPVEPCPYLKAKYEAKQGGIICCTISFYVLSQLFTKQWKRPAGLVIEEAHRLAPMVRNILKWSITDWILKRDIELLKSIGAEKEVLIFKRFLEKMKKIIKRKRGSTLLKDEEIQELLNELLKVNAKEILKRVKVAVAKGLIDPVKDLKTLKSLEIICREIPRYIRGFEYSLPTSTRGPLSFTYGYLRKELKPGQRFRYELVVQAHYVAQIIQKILAPYTLAYSATIGDPEIFSWETGIKAPFHSLPSEFPVENSKIFMPIDTPNLAYEVRRKEDVSKILRKIAEACQKLAKEHLRSLVIVVSEEERKKFISYSQKLGIDYLSYDGKKPREVLEEFKKGKGQVLVGTVAVYGEGIDLPKKLAPVIFFLRPGYSKPNDPANEFEERKWGKSIAWKLKNYRVIIEALQVRGRNIRRPQDMGTIFFIDQRFRRFVFSTLPEWLKPAYVGNLKFDEALNAAIKFLR
jgi:Rad3-related DNA helicase